MWVELQDGAAGHAAVAARPAGWRRNSAIPHWLAAGALLAAAFWLLRPSVAGVDDVTWLITASERLLGGQKLYLDVMEPNPPASVWLYVPAVWLAQLLGVKPELLVDVQTLLSLAAGLGLCTAILDCDRSSVRPTKVWILAGAFAFLTFMPQNIFGQRELYVLAAMLPLLAVLVRRAENLPVPAMLSLLAGLAGGVALAVKPVYAPCFGLAWLAGVWRNRRHSPLPLALVRIEVLACASVLLAYVLAVNIWVPQFFTQMVPLLALVYLPARMTAAELAGQPLFWLWLAAFAVAAALAAQRSSAITSVALAASLGAALAYLMQGKGFQDHAFPMLALAIAACGTIAFSGQGSRLVQGLALAAMLACTAALWPMMRAQWDLGLLRSTLQALQPQPRLLAVSHSLLLGHPLVRQLGGTWAARSPSLWVHNLGAARRMRETLDADTLARIETYERAERDMLLADILTGQPDIVLVQTTGKDWSQWVSEDEGISLALAAFADRGTVQGIRILQRMRPERRDRMGEPRL